MYCLVRRAAKETQARRRLSSDRDFVAIQLFIYLHSYPSTLPLDSIFQSALGNLIVANAS